MRKNNVLLLLLIGLCAAVFFGYLAYDNMRTDTAAPEIRMDGQAPAVSVADPKSALLQGVTAADDRDGDVTASLVVESVTLLDSTGNLSVRYAAFDKAGNVAKEERAARYTDYRSPRFSLSGPLAFAEGRNFDVLTIVGAEDVVDGDIQHRVRATSLDHTAVNTLGTHHVQFQVTNSLGDTVTEAFPVEVYEAGTYEAELELEEYLVYLPVGSSFNPRQYLHSFIFRGEETSLVQGLPRDYALRTAGEVLTQTPGTYPVEYRVTYTIRNEVSPERDQQFTGYSKLIVIVEG